MHHASSHNPGTTTISGPLENDGTIIVAGGTLDLQGPVTGNGTFDVENGGRLILASQVGGGETVDLSKGTAEFLGLAGSPSFTAAGPVYTSLMTITGLTAHSVIQIDGEAHGIYNGSMSALLFNNVTPNGLDLGLSATEGEPEWLVHLAGPYTPDEFHLTASGGAPVGGGYPTGNNAIITFTPTVPGHDG